MGQFSKVLDVLIVHTHSTIEDPGPQTRLRKNLKLTFKMVQNNYLKSRRLSYIVSLQQKYHSHKLSLTIRTTGLFESLHKTDNNISDDFPLVKSFINPLIFKLVSSLKLELNNHLENHIFIIFSYFPCLSCNTHNCFSDVNVLSSETYV